MMIRIRWKAEKEQVTAQISMGLRVGKTSVYNLKDSGTLVMSGEEWDLYLQTLERGAIKGVTIVTEESNFPEQQVV